jgi:hypothetical protein
LTDLLARSGEVDGFRPGAVQIFRSIADLRNASNDLSPAKSRRYEVEGFVEAAAVRMHDRAEPAAEGISGVIEFETPAGAMEELRAESAEELTSLRVLARRQSRFFVLRRLEVPGVSRSVAFSFETNKAAAENGIRSGIAKGLLVEGRCLMSVGVLRRRSKEVSSLIVGAVRSISGRTTGACT